jgi:hypothetical protein
MNTISLQYKNGKIVSNQPVLNNASYQLALGFGKKEILSTHAIYAELHTVFPNAQIALCSTAGEIYDREVLEDSVSIIAVEFEKTKISSALVEINAFDSSYSAGAGLISKLEQNDLKYVFILSDGGSVNGSELVRGVHSVIGSTIPVTGGLAGDGVNFISTLVGLNSEPAHGNIVAIGFYGNSIKIGHGSMGGWEMFGVEKTITKSSSNVLFEIDDENALDIYKKYLGKYADELPGSALLFPLSLKLPNEKESIVRTILSIDNNNRSMIFAGDVPIGSKVRFMRANFDKIIDAASVAAENSLTQFNIVEPQLAVLISCVGRKIILGKRVDEEVEAVADIFTNKTAIVGFYSYGEISPLNINTKCELHNQTMTVTTFKEI